MDLKRKSIPKYYDSLDAPVSVWEKVNVTNDVTWLLHKPQKVGDKIVGFLKKAWEKMFDEYVKEFGWSEHFIDLKVKEIELAKLQLEYLITGDGVLQTFIEVAQEELNYMQKDNGKVDFMESKIAIENKFKFQINMHTTSIREFYSYLKHLK